MITNVARASCPGAADEHLAPVFNRRWLQRVVLYSRTLRSSVGNEPVRRGRKAAGGRERSGAEPVRSRGGVGTVALRCPAPVRGKRKLDSAVGVRFGANSRAGNPLGWQFNAIATLTSGTPFTVSDSANVSLQANSPPISGFAASRPNLIGDPNNGPHTVNEWMSRSAFERLNIQTQAGQFGNAGRNIVRGPGYGNLDVSLVREITLPATRDCSCASRHSTSPIASTSGCRWLT